MTAKLLFLCLMAMPVLCEGQDASANRVAFGLGEPALTISLPCGTTAMESNVPLDKINSIQRFDTYRLYYAEGKVVGLFKFIQFNAPITESMQEVLETESNGVLNMIKAIPLQQETGDIQLQAWNGLQRRGSFMLENNPWIFIDVMFLRNNAMWQLWIAADQSDPARVTELKQILDSLHFKE